MTGKSYSTDIKISDFLDHRKFLAAVIEELKQRGVFSHRTFNRECGFTSPNFLQLVVQGKRSLSESAATRVAKVLALGKFETKLFLKMRVMNLEKDPAARLVLMRNLLRQPGFVERHELSQAELSFYSNWYNVIVRELLQSHPALTAVEIANALIPKVSENEIAQSLQDMVALGFIERQESRWIVLHRQLNTQNEILHQALVSFHSSMIDLARESLARFTGAEREVSSVTLQLTPDEFQELWERIRDFKREALTLEKTDPGAQVYQFNFQLFPVTSKITKSEGYKA